MFEEVELGEELESSPIEDFKEKDLNNATNRVITVSDKKYPYIEIDMRQGITPAIHKLYEGLAHKESAFGLDKSVGLYLKDHTACILAGYIYKEQVRGILDMLVLKKFPKKIYISSELVLEGDLMYSYCSLIN